VQLVLHMRKAQRLLEQSILPVQWKQSEGLAESRPGQVHRREQREPGEGPGQQGPRDKAAHEVAQTERPELGGKLNREKSRKTSYLGKAGDARE
jgi:hypothetical protein